MNQSDNKLTVKQKMVIEAILYFQEENHRSPTYVELAKLIGCKYANSAIQYVDTLEEKGYLKVTRNTARGIEVIKGYDE